ncbi:peroxisomal membrane protein 2 [Monodelphis domestica]|uniref:Peroxisomal membrane protein 2 n=1 Tax=Monodelphis domestica TaxID=13616 RepID=F7BWJ8_MONDO|nr:peroxisomal membrane protein 2 [Monodelphis domestica]
MAPVVSTLRAGAGAGARARSLPQRVLKQYLLLLRLYPVLTKSVTSGILSAFGNFLSQIIKSVQKKGRWSQNLDPRGPLRYAIFGFFFSGPLSHFFYLYLDHWIPAAVPFSGVRRLLLDRLVFAPAFLLLFFFCMNLLEGKNLAAFSAKVKTGYWTALQMNWKIWTPVQFININYIPLQFRVLFGNMVALFWYTYLASLGK